MTDKNKSAIFFYNLNPSPGITSMELLCQCPHKDTLTSHISTRALCRTLGQNAIA